MHIRDCRVLQTLSNKLWKPHFMVVALIAHIIEVSKKRLGQRCFPVNFAKIFENTTFN